MTAITISRKEGSRGGPIGQALARELGWKFVDRHFVDDVISEYGLVSLPDFYDERPKLRDLFDQDTQWTIEWMNKTVRTIAARHDVVIVGRGGFAALADCADVFNVLVTAPEDVRIERTMADRGLTEDKARKKVERDSKVKTRFVRRYYGKNWADESNYHLVVDTSECSEDEAVARIIEAAKPHLDGAQGARTADVEVDDLLLDTIEDAFRLQGDSQQF